MKIHATRHPLFDRVRNVVGYELRLRHGTLQSMQTSGNGHDDLLMLEAAIHSFGLDTLVGPHPATLRVDAEFMCRGHWAALPRDRVVLKLVVNEPVPPALAQACAEAKGQGVRLAIADANRVEGLDLLLPHAEVLGVDFALTSVPDRVDFVSTHGGSARLLMAEKVATYEQFREAAAAGYDRFQGYFFCEADEAFTARAVEARSASQVQLVAEANRPGSDLSALEELIKRDVALSIKLLRYLQSAAMGWRHEVATIGQGLRILGDHGARKWASLTAYSLIATDKPRELSTTSLIRAQLCEEFGRTAGLDAGRCSALFLVGLLSTLDALLDRPMAVAIADMPLTQDVAATLRGESTSLSEFLALAIAYDQGEWDDVDALTARLGLASEALPDAYHRTISWIGRLAAA